MKDFITSLREEYSSVVFIIDVVLNHISYDSDFLLLSNDSFYNLQNTKELTASYELEKEILKF